MINMHAFTGLIKPGDPADLHAVVTDDDASPNIAITVSSLLLMLLLLLLLLNSRAASQVAYVAEYWLKPPT